MSAAEPKVANGAPLGLLAFGLTTMLLNIHNAGFFGLSVTIVAMGFAMGGLAQIIVGIMEFIVNNMFGAVAFSAYGLFWWCLVIIWWKPLGDKAAGLDMGWFLTVWGIFSLVMFIGTLKHARSLQVVFGTLVLLFAALAVANFSGSATALHVAGWIGIICASSALYTSFGTILNHEYGRHIIPL
ncbi:MAG: acetate uptake transporter [Actinomycetia bacterium]|nr:acetate uptake transporter [Actinomycetes bacterium]